jgi:hypothetical protein
MVVNDASGNTKVSIQQTPANMNLFPRQDFNKDDFESLIEQKGYNVFHEKAILCPCKSKISDNQSSCLNCGGSGWIFLEKIQTRMLMFSMNSQTKYKDWSEDKLGTVSISCSDKDQISFMDKITQIDSDAIHKQIIYPILYEDKLFSYLNYNIKEILTCHLFINVNSKLKKLTIKDGDFTAENNVFYLNKKYYKGEDKIIQISLSYRHYNTYHVLDITRDVINSFILNEQIGKEESTKLPLAGIGRKAHYILDPAKFNETFILDNSK